MNWGKGIAFVYIGFVIFMVTLAYIASSQNFDLVSEDYYEQEINYQKKIDANANFNSSTTNVEFALNDSNFTILFPVVSDPKSLKGEIHCYKSSDASSDFLVPLIIDETGKQTINRNKFKTGLYVIKLSYTDSEKPYYVEKEIRF